MQSLPPRIVGEIICASLTGAERRPASVAWAAQLMPGKAYLRKAPHFIDMADMASADRKRLKHLYRKHLEPAAACHVVELREALVFGQGSVVLADGQILHDSIREYVGLRQVPDGAVTTLTGLGLPTKSIRRLDGRSLLVKRPWYRNPGHWLVDLMPLIPLCRQSAIGFDKILFGDVPEGALRTLMLETARTFSPDAQVEFINDDEQLRCERLLYVEPVHIPPSFKHPIAIQATVDACTIISGSVESGAQRRRRIYVSRQRAQSRFILNAEPLERLLEARGFETLFLEDMSLSEQIEAFDSADVIVGVKGAGLTNVIFSRPGTHLLVLSPSDFPDIFFWNLASQRGLSYAEIFFGDIPEPLGGGRSNFKVDPRRVDAYLGRIS